LHQTDRPVYRLPVRFTDRRLEPIWDKVRASERLTRGTASPSSNPTTCSASAGWPAT
jgi:hypothetical protein